MRQRKPKPSDVICTPILAENFRQKHILPTKEQEEDFVKSLKPSEKVWSYKQMKSPEELFNNGDWKGRAYNTPTLFQRIKYWLGIPSKEKKWYIENDTQN